MRLHKEICDEKVKDDFSNYVYPFCSQRYFDARTSGSSRWRSGHVRLTKKEHFTGRKISSAVGIDHAPPRLVSGIASHRKSISLIALLPIRQAQGLLVHHHEFVLTMMPLEESLSLSDKHFGIPHDHQISHLSGYPLPDHCLLTDGNSCSNQHGR